MAAATDDRTAGDRVAPLPTSRAAAMRDAVAGRAVRRVLDVGCGAGQEMLAFVCDLRIVGVGVDPLPSALTEGRQLYAEAAPAARVAFVLAAAEALPLPDGAFDVVISRVSLPYTDNRAALSEMARVLRPGGVMFLKVHDPRYYVRVIRQGLSGREWKRVVYGTRVLAAGAAYHVTGRQIRHRLVGGETFQTERMLRSELARAGMAIVARMPDHDSAQPSYLVERHASASSVALAPLPDWLLRQLARGHG